MLVRWKNNAQSFVGVNIIYLNYKISITETNIYYYLELKLHDIKNALEK